MAIQETDTTTTMAIQETTDNNTNLVFVYGTLKQGFYNHRLIHDLTRTRDATFLGAYSTLTQFPLVCGPHGVPYLINFPGSGSRIRGELYSVSDHGLSRLDDLEGVDRGHYERLLVNVEGGGEAVEAEAYFADRRFGEALWKRCGEVGLSEFTLEMGRRYVRREDRPSRCSSVNDIQVFISGSN